MRLKLVTVLGLCLLISAVFQPVAFAEETPAARTIPFTSKGFGAKLSPDGKTLITYENALLLGLDQIDPTNLPIHVIDVSSGEDRGQLSGFTDYANDAVFTDDGTKLISVHMNGDVNIWDMTSLKLTKSFTTPFIGGLQLRMFADNQRILLTAQGMPQHVVVMDIESGAILQTVGKHFDSYVQFQKDYGQFPGMGDIQLSAFALSPDGQLAATATMNDEVQLWMLADNQAQPVRDKSEKPGMFNIQQMMFTPDGKSLVYYDALDQKIHIWDIAGKSDQSMMIGADSFSLSADGGMITWLTRVKGGPGTVSVARLDAPDKANVIFTLPNTLQVARRVSWVYFLPDGKQVIAGGFFAPEVSDNQIYVLNVPAS